MDLQQIAKPEEAIISLILTKNTALLSATKYLRPEMFSDPRLAMIYATAEKTLKAGEIVNILSLKEALLREQQLEQIGGINYLIQLINNPMVEISIENGIRFLIRRHLKCKLINELNPTFTLKFIFHKFISVLCIHYFSKP